MYRDVSFIAHNRLQKEITVYKHTGLFIVIHVQLLASYLFDGECTHMAQLTARGVAALKPTERPYKRSDGKGLFIDVRPNGSKYWRMAYRDQGKQKDYQQSGAKQL